MEFGVFVGMYHPNHRREAGETEQDVLRAELDVVQAADRSGFKYVWVTEHHFLDEYSHLSANEAWMAYALAHHRAHPHRLGDHQLTPPVYHPARVAEKVAMLDHLAPGRFEFGTGRGLVVDRGARVRHRLDGHHPRHVRRGAARDRRR